MAKQVSETQQNPRVTVSFSRKFNMGNYESLGVDLGAWDDCHKGESIEEGFERLALVVQEQFEQLCGKIEGKKKGGK